MTAASVTEIQCGIGLMQQPTVALEAQEWLDGMILNGNPQVIDFDVHAAMLLGKMWTTPSLNNFIVNDPRSKKSKSGTDLTIAAMAITRGMVMVTGNIGDFLEIHAEFPLPGLFNPMKTAWFVKTLRDGS